MIDGINIDDSDKISQQILKTGWFTHSKKQYQNMIFENINFKCVDSITLLDIGSHIGLWCIRIGEFCEFFDIDFTGFLYEPSKSFESLKKTIREHNIKGDITFYNYAVGNKQQCYMKPNETGNLGSFDITQQRDGELVEFKIPDHEIKDFGILIMPCMSLDFEILKLFEDTYLQQDNIIVVAQLIEKNLKREKVTRENAISFMEDKGFVTKRYDFNYSDLDRHLEHTYFIFMKN